MRFLIILFIFFTTYSFTTSISHASACATFINDISDDITRYGNDIQNQTLPWMDTKWLIKNLGEPELKQEGGLILYKWPCSPEVYVEAVIDSKGNMREIRGQYSSSQGAGMFALQLTKKPEVSVKTVPEMKAVVSVEPQQPNADTTQPNIDESLAADPEIDPKMQAAYNYYRNLKDCVKGTYTLVLPYPIAPLEEAEKADKPQVIQMAEISGYQNGKCLVLNTVKMDGHTTKVKCAYSQESLDYLAAKKIAEMAQSPHNRRAITNMTENDFQKSLKITEECNR